jgi:branched-chain amino acid aminotransferase
VDGVVQPSEQAAIPVTDPGLLRGDGAFEVASVYDGVAFALEEHLDRLERTCAMIELGLDREAVRADVLELLEHAPERRLSVRFLVTRAGRRVALLERPPDPAPIALGFVTYEPSVVLTHAKTLSYAANMQATRLAQARGFGEAILVTRDGELLEAPTSALFLLTADRRLVTPPLEAGILDSITRRYIRGVVDVAEERCTPAMALTAREAFIASSGREIQPVRRIEDVDLPAPGPITERVVRAYRELVERAVDARARAVAP